MKLATSKSQRKYGKTESAIINELEETKPTRYKILVDYSNYTKEMTHEECLSYIEERTSIATKENRHPSSYQIVAI